MPSLTLRDIPKFPPPWAFASVGRPDERRGRTLARRAFVALKLAFMRAAAEVPGEIGQQLQQRVRHASEPIELWLMRASLLAALPEDCDNTENHRLAMLEALAGVFPSTEPSGENLSRW